MFQMLLSLSLVLVLLSSCGSSSSVPVGPDISGDPARVVYVALGASDAVGFNASISCDGPANRENRQPRQSDPLDCPNGTGYVPLIGQRLAADQLINLGLNGAVVGPQIRNLPVFARPPADILTDQVPRLPANATLISLWTGNNDTNQLALATAREVLQGQDPEAVIARQVGLFGSELAQVLAEIRQRSPNAQLVVGNIPNYALIPVGRNQPDSARMLLQEISIAINLQVLNPLARQGIPVADIGCDPRSYQDSSFFPGPLADGFHPNDLGYSRLADLFLATLQSPIAPAQCAFQDLGRRLPGSLADLDRAELETFVAGRQ